MHVLLRLRAGFVGVHEEARLQAKFAKWQAEGGLFIVEDGADVFVVNNGKWEPLPRQVPAEPAAP